MITCKQDEDGLSSIFLILSKNLWKKLTQNDTLWTQNVDFKPNKSKFQAKELI